MTAKTERVFSHFELDFRLALFSSLSAIDLEDPVALAEFDRVTASGEPFSYQDTAKKFTSQQHARVLGIVVGGYLMNWNEGGSKALATLWAYVHYFPPKDPDIEFQIIARLIELAQSYRTVGTTPSDEKVLEISDSAESFARFLAALEHYRPAKDLAALAVRLRKWAGARSKRSIMDFTLVLMGRSRRNMVPDLIPRVKYPPPVVCQIPGSVLREVVFAVIKSLFVDSFLQPSATSIFKSIDDLSKLAHEALQDQNESVFQSVEFEYQDPIARTVERRKLDRVAIHFSQRLLKRIYGQIGLLPGAEVTAGHFLFDLTLQIYTNRHYFESWRDEYLFTWYQLRGAEPYREDALYSDAVLFVMATNSLVSVFVGEQLSDIDEWTRYGLFASKSRELLNQARMQLKQRQLPAEPPAASSAPPQSVS